MLLFFKISETFNPLPANENNKANNCCLVSKEFVDNEFKYKYEEKEDCDLNKYNLNSNQTLINNTCNNIKDKIGSCRRSNFECIDFVDKDFCDKYNNMQWYNKTCHSMIPYVFDDRYKIVLPEIPSKLVYNFAPPDPNTLN